MFSRSFKGRIRDNGELTMSLILVQTLQEVAAPCTDRTYRIMRVVRDLRSPLLERLDRPLISSVSWHTCGLRGVERIHRSIYPPIHPPPTSPRSARRENSSVMRDNADQQFADPPLERSGCVELKRWGDRGIQRLSLCRAFGSRPTFHQATAGALLACLA